jgi:hypothetical protein
MQRISAKSIWIGLLVAALCGCAAPVADGPSKDWQRDLQRAIDERRQQQ